MYPDDLDIPEGEDEAKVTASAAGEIRAKGNENFKAVSSSLPLPCFLTYFSKGRKGLLFNCKGFEGLTAAGEGVDRTNSSRGTLPLRSPSSLSLPSTFRSSGTLTRACVPSAPRAAAAVQGNYQEAILKYSKAIRYLKSEAPAAATVRHCFPHH